MKHKFLLLISIVVLATSCATYNAGQTADDVYYSPTREVKEAEVKKREDRYQAPANPEEEQYIRMLVRNRNRWSVIDDNDYWYDSRYNHCNWNCNWAMNNWNTGFYYSPWRPIFGFGGMYSPAYPIVYYRNPKLYTGTTGKANLNTYRNSSYNNSNYNQTKGAPRSTGFGNLMRDVLTSGSSSSGNQTTVERPVRSFEPGTSTNSNAGGRSGGFNSTGSSSSSGRAPRN
jgi:hypothetical protein